MNPVNPFVESGTAEAYVQGRPYFHPLVIEKVKGKLELNTPVKLAVDVACGTGLSTRALLAIAERIVATDISEVMLSQAPKDARITYYQAPAEALPLEDASADLMTVSLAFHWFGREAFLREARRILRPQGSLVIYGTSFRWQDEVDSGLKAWLERYYAEHPEPTKNRTPFTDEGAQKAGFYFAERLTFRFTWPFELTDFVANLLSQSNAVAAVSSGRYSADELRLKLTEELAPFFNGEETFPFAGFIWLLRRI